MQGPSPLLAIHGVAKSFGSFEVLRAVHFSVRQGEVLGLIGPNGSGKTTLLECLAGLQATNGGEVRSLGTPLAPRKRRAVMFYLPENVVPYPEHHLCEVLAFFARVYRRPGTRDVVDLLGLSQSLARRVCQLSKGERRRLLLAIGLLTPHPILLMDEPFDGLDFRQTREAMAVLRSFAAQGRTLILSIHQLVDAERVCDRFVLLSHGRVAGEGTLAELQERAGQAGGSLEDIFLALS
ncbi:MAG TPA: ABC transporter ATP-binding protein [Pirellulales bacterium]|nr:ABC transporter ATP-binding protein [Pirellulales bacterium]